MGHSLSDPLNWNGEIKTDRHPRECVLGGCRSPNPLFLMQPRKFANLSTGVSRPDKSHYARQEYLGEAENVALACLFAKERQRRWRGRAGSSLAVTLPD